MKPVNNSVEPISNSVELKNTSMEHTTAPEPKKRKLHIIIPVIVILVLLLLAGIFVGAKLLQETLNVTDVEEETQESAGMEAEENAEEIENAESEEAREEVNKEENNEESSKGAEEEKDEKDVPAENVEKEEVEVEKAEEAPDYVAILQELEKSEMATQTPYKGIAAELAGILVGTQLLVPGETVAFDKLSAEENTHLNYMILAELPWGALADYVPQPKQMETGVGYTKEETENILHSAYQHEGEMHIDNMTFKEEGDRILFNYADGAPWVNFSGYSIKENANYIMISAPCYYGSNGGEDNIYQYNADILMKKTDKSLWGLQIVYARAYTKEIKISSAEATSHLPDYENKTYVPENLIDNNTNTAWVENVPGTGINETIVLHLGEKQWVQDVLLYNGYQQSVHLYDINGKVTGVEVDFGDGNVRNQILYVEEYTGGEEDAVVDVSLERISLEHPIYTDTIKIKITDACEGTKYSDTCISEIKLYWF